MISARRHGWRVRRACVFGEWQRSVFKVHAFIWVKTARSRVAAQGKFGPMGCQEYMWVFFPHLFLTAAEASIRSSDGLHDEITQCTRKLGTAHAERRAQHWIASESDTTLHRVGEHVCA